MFVWDVGTFLSKFLLSLVGYLQTYCSICKLHMAYMYGTCVGQAVGGQIKPSSICVSVSNTAPIEIPHCTYVHLYVCVCV